MRFLLALPFIVSFAVLIVLSVVRPGRLKARNDLSDQGADEGGRAFFQHGGAE